MSHEITAKLLSSLPEQTGSGKNGTWVKQDFIVETEDQYPKKICMSAWGDLVKQFKKSLELKIMKCRFPMNNIFHAIHLVKMTRFL